MDTNDDVRRWLAGAASLPESSLPPDVGGLMRRGRRRRRSIVLGAATAATACVVAGYGSVNALTGPATLPAASAGCAGEVRRTVTDHVRAGYVPVRARTDGRRIPLRAGGSQGSGQWLVSVRPLGRGTVPERITIWDLTPATELAAGEYVLFLKSDGRAAGVYVDSAAAVFPVRGQNVSVRCGKGRAAMSIERLTGIIKAADRG